MLTKEDAGEGSLGGEEENKATESQGSREGRKAGSPTARASQGLREDRGPRGPQSPGGTRPTKCSEPLPALPLQVPANSCLRRKPQHLAPQQDGTRAQATGERAMLQKLLLSSDVVPRPTGANAERQRPRVIQRSDRAFSHDLKNGTVKHQFPV